MLTKRQKIFLILSANILIFLAVFLLLELAVRVFVPESIPLGNQTRQFWTHDSLLGWAHRKGISGIQNIQGKEIQVSINSKGLREDEVEYSPDSRYRILLLGDSFGWGFGVELNDRMSNRIEDQLDSLEIINASVAGYSTDQQLLYYQHEGYKYHADLVMVLFCENDFLGNTLRRIHWYNKPLFTAEGDSLLLSNVPVPELSFYQRVRRFLSGKSHLLSLLLKRIAFINTSSYSNDLNEADYAGIITEKILKSLKNAVSNDKAELLLVAIPMSEKLNNTLREIADRNRIRYLDLTPFFTDQNDIIIPGDGHWNARGNKIAAYAVIQAIKGGMSERR